MYSILTAYDGVSLVQRRLFELGRSFLKEASVPEPSYSLSGMLYVTPGGYGMLSVPNAIVRGVFNAMDEHGVELPPGPDGKLNAHITVFRPEELEMIGGPEKLTERGKRFYYRIGGLTTVDNPGGWQEIARVWMLRVHSPELQALRRSYGLSGLPNNGKYEFHITCAVRRKGVLGRNEVAKS